MSKAETGGAAFPTIDCDEASLSNGGSYTLEHGMTKREYFAAKAMQGLLAANDYSTSVTYVLNGVTSYRAVARNAVEAADALIAALKD
jgi:hypothetical protein